MNAYQEQLFQVTGHIKPFFTVLKTVMDSDISVIAHQS